MKRMVLSFLAFAIPLLLFPAFAGAKTITADYTVFFIGKGTYSINSHTVQDVAPYVKDGRTLLPLRYAAYAVGIGDNSIVWDAPTKTAYLRKGDVIISIQDGAKEMRVGNRIVPLEVPAEIKQGRMMLPMRAIGEAFGATVEWVPEYKAVVIFPLTRRGEVERCVQAFDMPWPFCSASSLS